jgi:hypothetical protein
MKSWPIRIVGIYICIIIILALSYFVGFYRPASGMEGELYFPYFFASGPIVWILSDMVSSYFQIFIESLLKIQINPTIGIVVIPGVFNILLGSVQWYYITMFAITLWKKSKHSKGD